MDKTVDDGKIRRRMRLIAERRCTCCGVQDSRTLAGKQYCIPCYSRQREYGRRRREYLKSLGRCECCSAKDKRTESGFALCEVCASREKMRNEQKRAERVCARCGKQDERTLTGFTYCAECNEKINIKRRIAEKRRRSHESER
jgi:hypothetical protein